MGWGLNGGKEKKKIRNGRTSVEILSRGWWHRMTDDENGDMKSHQHWNIITQLTHYTRKQFRTPVTLTREDTHSCSLSHSA